MSDEPQFFTLKQAMESALTETRLAWADSLYGVQMQLSALDRHMLTSPDGKRVTVSLEAIRELLIRQREA
jgi:hypothetical protein